MQPKPIQPGPDQQSVWDYPRPPVLQDVPQRIRILLGGQTIADTTAAKRVLETSHPPTYYLPPADIEMELLHEASGGSFCEWKGRAIYFDVRIGNKIVNNAAWAYTNPTAKFVSLKDHLAFYAHLMDACYVGDELATPQPGNFYGGWVTSQVVGPFKGGPGSMGW